jgi:putative ABC transport system permease protein
MLADLRLAARTLARARRATALQLATIAIGVGGLAAVLAVVGAVILRPLPFEEPDGLATIEVTSSRGFSISNSIPNLRDWRDRTRTLDQAGGLAGWDFRMRRGDGSEILRGAAVYGDLFGVLRIQPALGRFFNAAETEPGSPPLVILGHSLWERAFAGDRDIIGTAITLGSSPHTVVGVLPRDFAFPRTEPDVLVNMGSIAGLPWDDRGSSFGTRMFVRLSPGTSFELAADDVERVGAELKAENGPTTALPSLVSMTDYLVGDHDRQLYVLLAAVGIVMLIAIGNAGSLVLARAADRRRDVAVRLALGGGHADLRRNFLVENILLTTAGGALGLVLAVALVRALVPMLPDDLPQVLLSRIAIDAPTIAMTLAICAAFGVLFGIVAARHAVPGRLNESLRSGTSSIVAPRTRARSALLVGETALSLMLASGAGLFLTTFLNLRSSDKGFDESGILVGRITRSADAAQWIGYYASLIEQARAVPGVTHAAVSLHLPLTNRSWELRVQPFGASEPVDEGPSVLYNQVSNGYFETLSIPLTAGRGFNDADNEASPPVAIIDETLARLFWPGQDPIGQRVTIDERGADSLLLYRTVIGVVKNVRHYTLREPSRVQLYVPIQQSLARWGSSLTFSVRSSVPPEAVIAPVRQVATAVDPGAAIWNVQSLSRYVDESISTERTLGVITVWLAAVASLVTAVGLFALVSYAVGQRRREIALRLALGSTPGEVVGLMTWSGASMGLIGVAIGIAGAVAMSRLIRGFLFEVQPLDPMVHATSGAVLIGVTVLASLLPALGARRMAPASVLRED